MNRLTSLAALLGLCVALHSQPIATLTNSLAWDNPNEATLVDHYDLLVLDGQSKQVATLSTTATEASCRSIMGSLPNGLYTIVGYVVGTEGQRSAESASLVFKWAGAPPVVPTIEPPKPVFIYQQPVSVTLKRGQDAVFTVGATGTGLTYQWFSGSAVDGATGPTLVVPASQVVSGREYLCVVKNATGQGKATDIVKAVVLAPPALGPMKNLRVR